MSYKCIKGILKVNSCLISRSEIRAELLKCGKYSNPINEVVFVFLILEVLSTVFFIERGNGGHIISSLKYFLYSDDKMLVFSTKFKVSSTLSIARLLVLRLSTIKPMLCDKARAKMFVGVVQ